MKRATTFFTLLICLTSTFGALSQTTPSNKAYITHFNERHIPSGDSTIFQVDSLIPSDTSAWFMYLWWAGDNGFSFSPSPKHNHMVSPGSQAKMTAITTENYGTGGPPPLTYSFTTENEGTELPKVLGANNSTYVQTYRNAVIRDTMYLIITYGNPSLIPINGTLEINVGDHAKICDGVLANNPHYLPNEEEWLPNENKLNYQNLEPNEEHSILIPVKIRNNREDFLEMEVFNNKEGYAENSGVQGKDYFKISPAVAHSHDPNMMIEESKAKYQCDYGGEKIHYTVKFQNDGEGQTHYIRIECHLDENLDMNSITNIQVPDKFYTSCRDTARVHEEYVKNCGAIWSVDPSTHILTIEMHDITLYSSIDANLPRIDMAQGQIEFDICVASNYKFGTPVVSYSKIFFDDNPAIVTNDATTGCLRYEAQSFICEYKWWFIGGLLLIILLIILLIRRKRKRKKALNQSKKAE